MSSHVLGHHNVVVDSCWTLLPLFTLSAMLAAMVNKNSALFYVAFMDEFGVSHQAASWPITMHGVVTHLTGLLVSLLQKKLSTYQIAVSGCLLNFTALVASAFAPTIVWMTITLGAIAGVGYGMIVLSLSIYAMVYFDKYRGTASGFKYTGMTLAPLAFPLALSALIRSYNLSGTLLLLSAITLHTLPLTMLMNNPRPVTCWCRKKQRREALALSLHKGYGTKGENAVVACEKQKASLVIYRQMSPKEAWQEGGGTFRYTHNGTTGHRGSVHNRTNHTRVVSSDTVRGSRKSFEEQNGGLVPKAPLAIVLGATEDRRKHTALSPSDENQDNDLNGLRDLGKNHLAIETKESNVNKGVSSKSESTNIRDLLRNPLLYLLVAAFTANEYTTDTFEMTVLDYAIDKGTERSQAEPIITYVAAAQLVGRLSIPFLWESARLPRSLLVALSLTVAAISLVVMPHVHSFTLMLVTSLIMGCSSGCVVVLKPVLLSDHLGVQMLPFCWGLAGVAMVPFSLGGSLLIGLFRDTMGSYDNLYRTLSAFCFVFAIMLFTLAFFERRAAKRLDHVKKLNETHIGPK